MPTTLAHARQLDAQDPLAAFRDRFVITDPDLIYLDGNSLGRMPAAAADLAGDLVQRQWGDRLIRSWNEGWWEAPQRIGAKIARLIGAQPDEVIVADSTSVNLFKLVIAALRARPDRTRILTDDLNFPSDLYVLEGIADLLGGRHRVEVVPRRMGFMVRPRLLWTGWTGTWPWLRFPTRFLRAGMCMTWPGFPRPCMMWAGWCCGI